MAGYILQNIEKCDLCEGLHFTLYTEKDSFNIAKCVNCGLVCLDYVPKAEESKRLYTEPYFRNSDGTWSSKGYPDYFAIENILRKVFSKKLKKLMELKNSGLLLDIGCSAGFFLDVARQHFDVLGVDISDFAAEYGKKVFGIDIFTTPLEDCKFESDNFDVITLWDSVEHLSRPRETLLEINRVLRKDGLLVVQTGDIDSIFSKLTGKRWHLLTPPEHIYYFSRKTISMMLRKAGFKVVKVGYEWSCFSIAYLIDRLARMLFPSGKYENKIPMLEKIYLPVNLFDITTVYAVKE